MKLSITYKHFTIDNTSFFKGVGILLIAFHNFFHWVSPNPSENEFDFSIDRIHGLWNSLIHNPADVVNLMFSYFGHYGVQLFILFSGYGLMRSYMNRKIVWSDFMLKRLNKLFPTFIIAALILIGLNFYKYNTLLGYVNIRDFFVKFSLISNFIPGKALTINGPWWFYSMIVQLYAVFPIIVWLYKKFKEISLLILVVASYILLILFNDYFIKIDATLYYQFIGHLPEFILGVYFATRKEIKLNLILVFGFLVLFVLGNIYKLPWYFSHLSVTVLLFIAVNYLFRKLNKTRKTYKGIIFYGELSMYLFAVHGFLRGPFVALANEKNNALYTLLIAISFVATSTLVALAIKYIEQNYLTIRKRALNYLNKLELNKKIFKNIFNFLNLFYKYVIILIVFLLFIKVFEFFLVSSSHPSIKLTYNALNSGLFNEFFNILGQSAIFIIPFYIFYIISKKLTKILLISFISIIIILNIILIQYFNTTLVPLDHVILVYTYSGLIKIIKSSVDFNFYTILPFLGIGIILFALIKLFRKLKLSNLFIVSILLISLIFIKSHKYFLLNNNNFENENEYFFANNLLTYFVSDGYKYIKEKGKDKNLNANKIEKSIKFYQKINNNKNYTSSEFPILYNENYNVNTLGNYFTIDKKTKPNIVIIIVESLCDQISGKYASIGSFTPFLDSLEQHSLYWRNNLSSSERTFGVLPTVLGSLPPAKTGFMETDKAMPIHYTMLSLLSKQNYESNFYYGGWMDFDNMKNFLLKNQITNLITNYDTSYSLDTSKYDSWGYPDYIVFKKGAEDFATKKEPFLDLFLTLSTHSPFLLKNQEKYIEKVKSRIITKKYNSEFLNTKTHIRIMSTVMYLDDAIRMYFNKIKNTKQFKNTIFVITGDHKMGPIPINNNVEKYHVPLIIYSPKLKKAEEFGAISSHYDVAPSLTSLLKNNYNVTFPNQMHYIGSCIDTTKNFNAKTFIPFMRINRDILDICYDDKFLSDGKTFELKDNLKANEIADDKDLDTLLKSFIDVNNYVCEKNKILPINLYRSVDISSYLFLYKSNFDTKNPEYYEPYISNEISSSGKSSLKIKKENEFVTLIPDQKINDSYNRLLFNISFNVFCKDTSQGKPVIVCHVVDKDNKTIFWNKIDFTTNTDSSKTSWVNVNRNMQVLIDRPEKGYVFKAYIWNSKAQFYIDDLDVSVSGKQIH